ncbi:WD repeat-containing protein 75-like [Uloborus diversus]|uniref:WD repeat-containing protein 75-like n=1 Tax=Uloborus diversus TaxID=327109 RepID=UPI00240905A0|nr:WD repeat-containing protein 75-like [Uloborus diversus]
MAVNTLDQDEKEPCELKVKLKVGASIINSKSLFTHDSASVIVSNGCDIKIFNILSGECVHTVTHHRSQVIAIRQNKNNPLQILSCSSDGIIVRWDLGDGKALQVLNCCMPISAFFAPSAKGPWFVTKKFEDHFRLYSIDGKGRKATNVQMVMKPVLPAENTVAFSFEGKYVASVLEKILKIHEVETKHSVRHFIGQHRLTCVAFHPSELVLATGDSSGRALVWSDILNSKNPIKSIFHWHTLPLADLVFSTEGSYLYSGGGEAALVKWNLFSNERFVIPRLGAPICALAISPSNSYVLTAHEDNGLQVIDSRRTVVQSIQGLTRCYFRGSSVKKTVPTGMLYDPGTGALVMNGKPGHLQFYDVNLDKQLFNLDITSRNYVSRERDAEVFNVDVQCAAFDSHGSWLATAEFWHDGQTSPQIWLKFWKFDTTKNNFVLNTNVILPHEKDINCIVFRPLTTESPMAVTCSNDCKLKVWSLKSLDNDKESWTCEAMGCYRDLPVGDACFSEEGSVMAVAFSGVATLWTVDKISLKEVLYSDKSEGDIKQLTFGRGTCSHYLICHDGASIVVWNVLNLTISWLVHSEIQTFTLDPISGLIAAFTQDQNLIIFKPNSPHPVFSLEKVSEKPIMSALFIPIPDSINEEMSCFHSKSQLFFLDQDQNLFTLTDDPEVELEWKHKTDKKIVVSRNIPLTPFGMLKAEHSVTDVTMTEPIELDVNLNNNKDMFEISCPTLMDPLALCSSILPTLLISAKKTPKIPEPTTDGKSEYYDSEEKQSKSEDVGYLSSNGNFFTDFSFLREVFSSK